jgi:cell division septation protein DedD
MPLRISKLSGATYLRAGAVALSALALSSCANMSNIEFFPAFNRGEDAQAAPIAAQPLDPLSAPAPAAAAIDPLNAPPPPAPTASMAVAAVDPLKADPMAASAGAPSGSQMVPLGSLNAADVAAAPKRSGPAPLIPNAPQAQAQQPRAVQPAPQPMPAAAPAPVAPTPAAPAPMPSVAQAPPQPAMAQPETVAASPKRATLSDFFNRTLPSTNAEVAAPGTGVLMPTPAPPEAREFVPAQISAAEPMTGAAKSAPKLSAGENNIIRRFEVLARLLDEGLMTQEEFDKRRAANVGALLPYSKEPPAVGLDRPVPAPGAISARLQALGRSLEMRAITARQHELERSTILNSLLPERPDPRAPKAPPPSDMFALADAASRLGYLREESLIGEGEFDAEKTAMDRVMRGADPVDRKPLASARSGSASGASSAAAKPAAPAAAPAASEPPPPETFTGPVLHLASFRSAEGARSGFEQAKTKNPELFANLRLEARRTNVPGQGTFYRLLVGPFASLADAEATCVEMKKVDQFCRPTADGS